MEWIDGVKLTNLELELLKYFAKNPERVISRDELLEQVWKLPKQAPPGSVTKHTYGWLVE